MGACYWIKVPYQWREGKKEKNWKAVLFSGARTLKNWKEFTNETSDRCLQENWIFCARLLTAFRITCNNCSTVSGACGWSTRPNDLHFSRAVRAAFYEHVMPFTSLVTVSHTTWWGDSRSLCCRTFRLNISKLIQEWQGSSSSLGEIYRSVFVRFMSLCN